MIKLNLIFAVLALPLCTVSLADTKKCPLPETVKTHMASGAISFKDKDSGIEYSFGAIFPDITSVEFESAEISFPPKSDKGNTLICHYKSAHAPVLAYAKQGEKPGSKFKPSGSDWQAGNEEGMKRCSSNTVDGCPFTADNY